MCVCVCSCVCVCVCDEWVCVDPAYPTFRERSTPATAGAADAEQGRRLHWPTDGPPPPSLLLHPDRAWRGNRRHGNRHGHCGRHGDGGARDPEPEVVPGGKGKFPVAGHVR